MGVTLRPDALAAELAARGLRQSDLARLAHVSVGTITAAMRGDSLRYRTAFAIATALERTPRSDIGDRIFAGAGDSK